MEAVQRAFDYKAGLNGSAFLLTVAFWITLYQQ
jgi:hypothetical protein